MPRNGLKSNLELRLKLRHSAGRVCGAPRSRKLSLLRRFRWRRRGCARCRLRQLEAAKRYRHKRVHGRALQPQERQLLGMLERERDQKLIAGVTGRQLAARRPTTGRQWAKPQHRWRAPTSGQIYLVALQKLNPLGTLPPTPGTATWEVNGPPCRQLRLNRSNHGSSSNRPNAKRTVYGATRPRPPSPCPIFNGSNNRNSSSTTGRSHSKRTLENWHTT